MIERPGIVRRVTAWMLDSLLPPSCVTRGCGRTGAWLCDRCLAAVRPLPPDRCSICNDPAGGGDPCARCGRDPPAWDLAIACGRYAGPLRDAVTALKFQRRRAVAYALGPLMARSVLDTGVSADLVVPVPSHPERRRQRGIDATALLARSLARSMRRPCRGTDELKRVRHTAPQVGRSLAERRANVHGAFLALSAVRGRRVWLVDDVLTTGATCDECATALHEAGATWVGVVTVARASALDSDRTGVPSFR